MNMKNWWNDREKTETVGNKPVPVHFAHQKSHTNWSGIKKKDELIFTFEFMKLSTGKILLSVILRLMMLHYFCNLTLGEVFVHQRQLIYTPGILLANNGPLSVGGKMAFIKWPFFIRTCTVATSTKWNVH